MTLFITRNWQALLGGLAVLILSGLLWSARNERDSWHTKSDLVTAQFDKFRSDSAAAAAQMQARYASNALRVQTEQDRISREASSDYQTRLAELNARVASLRASSRASADRGRSPMPPASNLPGGTATASSEDRLPPDDAIIATAQAIQLDELIKVIRRQQEVQR